MNPYQSPNIPNRNRVGDDSELTHWKNAKLETCSIAFGISFLTIVISLSLYREYSFRPGESNFLTWISDPQLSPMVGILGGVMSSFLLMQLLAWGERLASRR